MSHSREQGMASYPGPHNGVTDVAGVLVGQVTDPVRATGTSALILPEGSVASGDVRGGAPGTRETDVLQPSCLVTQADAFVFSGGSAYGLAAGDGAMRALANMGRGFAVGPVRVPIVPTAIIFDLLTGAPETDLADYTALGAEAVQQAQSGPVAVGAVGAGTGARAGTRAGGVGTASAVLSGGFVDGFVVAAFVVVNPVGSLTTPAGHLYAAAYLQGDERQTAQGDAPVAGEVSDVHIPKLAHLMGNTTVGAVVTTAALNKAEAQRLAIMAHDGLARAIRPIHTPFDGDTVFAAATGSQSLQMSCDQDQRALALAYLGMAAADCMTRAVARAL